VAAANGFGADGWRMRFYPGALYASPAPTNYFGQSYGSRYYAYTYDPQDNLLQRHAQGGGAVLDTLAYDAFGGVTADLAGQSADTTTGHGPGPARYKDPASPHAGFGGQFGYYLDPETGLDLLTNRYYDGGMGRFLTRDPIGYKGGVNLYGFAGNNPVNEQDPSGLQSPSLGDSMDGTGGITPVFKPKPAKKPSWWELFVGFFSGAVAASAEYPDPGAVPYETYHADGSTTGAGVEGVERAGKEPHPPYVYRGLAENEDVSRGLSARAPGAIAEPKSHVMGLKKSPFISTTKDMVVAMGKYGKHGAVRVDLSKVPSEVIDISKGIDRWGRPYTWPRKDKEVLVRGIFPLRLSCASSKMQKAITIVNGWALKQGDMVLGRLLNPVLNQPWFNCEFEPTPEFSRVKPLFDKEITLLNSGLVTPENEAEWEKAVDEIDALRLALHALGSGSVIQDFLLHIQDKEAWFRY
jgi:RHS repeat-associated protein